MKLHLALALFRLEGRIPVEELNTTFRDLVKKYHPDKVREHPEWAHERMAEINNAYETLIAWLAQPVESPPETVEEEAPIDTENDGPLDETRSQEFYQQFNRFLNGLGLYYQYGLDNPAYRQEGVRRFRFRESLRSMESARDALENCALHHPTYQIVMRFVRLTIADINLGEPSFPARPGVSYRHHDSRLKAARKSLDQGVKNLLFPELVPPHLKARIAAGLYTCYAEFINYLSASDQGERRNAGILQTARYDTLLDLIELRNKNRIVF